MATFFAHYLTPATLKPNRGVFRGYYHTMETNPILEPELPWMKWEIGQRVVVRYRLDDGLYDALGHLTEIAPDHVTVNTRRGLITVHAQTMVTGKVVPESPF